jgi:hypothetical protein
LKRPILLWTVALLITLASAVYQRLTGPTYPVRGTVRLGGTQVRYNLKRTQGGPGNHQVRVETADAAIAGTVFWKRHKMDEPWTRVPMTRVEGALTAELPHQPPAGKLDYGVELEKAGASVTLPLSGGTVIRFKGDVPTPVLIVHVIAMFSAMLFSTRAGLEALAGGRRLTGLIHSTLLLLFAGGLILGPIVQKYAFDAYWTGWPFGQDLTDNKTFVAFAVWAVAMFAMKRSRNPKVWAVGASLITLVVFLIPHSVLGSEFDYSKVPAGK